ncbi:GTP pyrophosphokinase [Acetitomaculum ruminis DSM 5522]|uniref:GTP diphosphokinase n=1 Tax=Acetitomaculum ruminis DSM 5522 TaxID=1120918 RepID=A0A1I1ADI4_9FIRM|nr:bifunctional (p)ppGpp synthetase/guanosine-3',5'-bis(diphosphate) 3'-pyrophosphohydrolase [Acetitomaculum ruminis]SFB36059.1 GTP pyrophosphokinase [Acetitomaculum ruminis DSM 5522]
MKESSEFAKGEKKEEFVEENVRDMDDFTSPEDIYKELIASVKKYHPSDDTSMIEKAYNLAKTAHEGQKRKSGEPYIIHPLCTALILADLELDKETITAGILHDVVEDTIKTLDEIKDEFGEEVALLVDGVTKLGQLSYDADKIEIQAENLRKMFLAMANDIRVILIKLADRLHNMRTLQYMRPEKQKEKARETMDIYAPIAQRLGISKIKIELDDLALKYLEPDVYRDLVEKINLRKSEREYFIKDIVEVISDYLKESDIDAYIYGRAKHFFSIYKKMVNQNKTLDQIYDLFAIRIIVESIKDCYAVLGIIHTKYKPIPGRFKDYIAMPKDNMYQSLHTTLISDNGTPFEVQIRTYEMHRIAEYGIAAHWKYKESSDGKKVGKNQEEEKLAWLRQILEWQQDMSDNKEFMNLLKSDLDLFSDSVFCFTPTGDVKSLPAGSTPVDFAYSIHSAVGNKMIGAKINGKLVPIDYRLQNGDRVEVLTSQNSKGPSRDWLNIVKSTQAKNKINQWFRHASKDDNIAKGKELLGQYCKVKGINQSDISKSEYITTITKKYGFDSWDSVLATVGRGGLKEGQVINRLVEEFRKDKVKSVTDKDILEQQDNEINQVHDKPRSKSGITVKGIHDVAVRFSKCCSPVPGDEICGFVTRGRGVSIHRTDCINIINLSEFDRNRLIDAEWESVNERIPGLYLAEIKIYGNNRTGLLVDISKIFTERQIDINSINSRTSKQGIATIAIAFGIKSKTELNSLIEKIRQVESVIDVERTTG